VGRKYARLTHSVRSARRQRQRNMLWPVASHPTVLLRRQADLSWWWLPRVEHAEYTYPLNASRSCCFLPSFTPRLHLFISKVLHCMPNPTDEPPSSVKRAPTHLRGARHLVYSFRFLQCQRSDLVSPFFERRERCQQQSTIASIIAREALLPLCSAR
jgi:hypothetical protein